MQYIDIEAVVRSQKISKHFEENVVGLGKLKGSHLAPGTGRALRPRRPVCLLGLLGKYQAGQGNSEAAC